ncbi:MAG TPA: RidA family protein [Burkholderiaceae bacterium]|jgi:enamine deaminase RidA (YjgF/YER057c/UK114 family)|nr:RidA family protein [Burkholderiaceae bacterium]
MSIEFINPGNMSGGSYSHAAVVSGGRTVFLSGQVSVDGSGKVVGTTFEEQTEQVFANLANVLSAAGARWQDVVKMNVYVRDLTSTRVRQFREIRQRHLGAHKPASTLVATPALVHEDMMLEVEVVAHIE